MRVNGIVERKVLVETASDSIHRFVVFQIHLLVLHTAPQALGENIIHGSSAAVHADAHMVGFPKIKVVMTRKLNALVTVGNFGQAVGLNGGLGRSMQKPASSASCFQ